MTDHDLISTACVPAPEGFFVSTRAGFGREPAVAAEMDQVLAWRIDTFKIRGDAVPLSTVTPVTINGSLDSAEYALLRPDGTVEYPDGSSIAVGGSTRLRLVDDKL
ncbi:MAG: hypothetical protein DI555_20155 [Novosphingobium pentaromativorans]|uniref:Uncharacterized protein n=1 Tax=Novosphingobium pentaromativorans TaxID=205844 RepID=A0A2W5NM75_9SPHN|nr:MAG: hypothetical protein DI555_20155 [Novosphingobium pentaromativorans]